MAFTRFVAPQARALLTRSFASSSRVAGPRSLATPFASAVSSKPSSQEMADHYNKFLDVYQNDTLLVSTHTLQSRTITHYPVEEVIEAPINMKSQDSGAAPTTADSYSPGNNVYFVDGRDGKLAFA
ncbi:hypothetical protein P389DRAFT_74203 [Cystobasidium minutum MCA 4210]|uniref:uncharacterized protein n=1 Tax=Cystobasidium minutum MCA 4210 TaxID=1397322 RepID=UPI0034D0078A|eukprot:jgi/Rhomi1/74203/CE74202_426